MRDLIVSVPDHCSSFYFTIRIPLYLVVAVIINKTKQKKNKQKNKQTDN